LADRREDDDYPVGDPHRFPDGRPKSSPDDTSLLGLAAVWSEIEAPMPPKRSPGRGGSHQRRGARRARRARRGRRTQPLGLPVVIGLVVAFAVALGVIAVLVALLS
jgi:hypothetical protein